MTTTAYTSPGCLLPSRRLTSSRSSRASGSSPAFGRLGVLLQSCLLLSLSSPLVKSCYGSHEQCVARKSFPIFYLFFAYGVSFSCENIQGCCRNDHQQPVVDAFRSRQVVVRKLRCVFNFVRLLRGGCCVVQARRVLLSRVGRIVLARLACGLLSS